MSFSKAGRPIFLCLGILLLWLSVQYLLPLFYPFLIGLAVAALFEPLTRRLAGHLPRWAACGICISAALMGLAGAVVLVAAGAVRELGHLASIVPDLGLAAKQGLLQLQDLLLQLAAKAPDSVEPMLTQRVLRLSGSGNALMEKLTDQLPRLASGVLERIPNGALTLGTTVLSSYMFSARLPKIREFFHTKLPDAFYDKYLPALSRLKAALSGWLKAQAKLCGISFVILTLGLTIFRVSYAPVWAGLISVVDALPLLGSGTVLLPWAIVCFFQGNRILSMGLLGTYAATFLTRTILEPRLLGKQLGLDPLLTLVAMYVGFRLWGFWGMVLSPILGVIIGEFLEYRG